LLETEEGHQAGAQGLAGSDIRSNAKGTQVALPLQPPMEGVKIVESPPPIPFCPPEKHNMDTEG